MINVTTRKIGGNVIAALIRGDNATTAIRFNVPERADGVDLSGLSWAVLIRNAAGETDVYVPALAERDGHFITFGWFPGGVATAAAGMTEVMISGTAQADNPPVWQSATYYVRVDEKVDADPAGDDAVQLTELQQLIVYVQSNLPDVIDAGRAAQEAASRANEAAERAESIAGVAIDGTLTQPGAAADAAVVGGKFDELSEEIDDQGKAIEGKQPKGDYALKSEIPAPYILPVASADMLGGVKVGNGLQMDGEVLIVKPEGEYKLIETITVDEERVGQLKRTQEPDGTLYNFKRLLIKAQLKPTEATATLNIWINSSGQALSIEKGTLTNSESFSSGIIWIENGIIRCEGNAGMAGEYLIPQKVGTSYSRMLAPGTHIYDVLFVLTGNMKFEPGSIIEIWGVRTNA